MMMNGADSPIALNAVSETATVRTGLPPSAAAARTVVEAFAAWAATCPAHAAVSDDDMVVSYAELDRRANAVAHALLDGVGRGARAAVLLPQGAGMIAAALGAMKSATVFAPLDPADPPKRLAQLLRDFDAQIVLTDGRHVDAARAVAGPDCSCIDIGGIAAYGGQCAPDRDVDSDQIAYVIYTSGSTGHPKGVCQTHANLMHFVRVYTRELGIGHGDRLTWFFSPAFSASMLDVFGALSSGATLYPCAIAERGLNGLAHWLGANGITVFHSVPTVYRRFAGALAGANALPRLRVVDLGGEPVLAADVRLFRERFPERCTLINHYAATEISVIAQHRTSAEDEACAGPIPMGRAADGVELLVLNEHGERCAAGEEGEIYIRSRHLTPGYWRRPDLTAAAFTGAAGDKGLRGYRSGDRGVMRADGTLVHLGRAGTRLKVRGYSVELSEIESALASVDGVAESAAGAWHDRHGDARLEAYVVGRGGNPPDPASIRACLAQQLPHYMLPSRITVLEQLPLLPSGKIDRGALQFMPARGAVGREPTAPATRTERTVAHAWETELGCVLTDVHTEFADLGGDSANAVALCLRLSEICGVDIQPFDLYQAPTVAALSARIDGMRNTHSSTNRTSPLVALRPGGRRPPWFLVPGASGDAHVAFSFYGRIARHLDGDQPLYAFLTRGTRGEAFTFEDVVQMAADYLLELKRIQPVGPYHLVGGCIGGSVAFEMAQQLHAAGEELRALVLLDAPYPQTITAARRGRSLRANMRFLDTLLQRVTHHCKELRGMSAQTAVTYLWHKIRMFPRFYLMVTYRWARHHPDARTARRIEQAIESRRGHIAAYQPQPYAGKVTVITSEEWRGLERTGRWERVAAGGVDFYVTPGSHESQLLDHADKVAAILSACAV